MGVIAENGASIAFVEWSGLVLAPRMLLISFGGPEAAQRIRERLGAIRGSAWNRLRITAVPAGDEVPTGDIVFPREHYTFVVSHGA
jgi:hypothetical protein